MKNAKNYLALLLVLGILFLAACRPAAPQDPGSSAPETSESTQTEPSQADPTEPSQTEPTQQTEPTEEDLLAKLDALFGGNTWYNIALTSFYETPEQIDLKCFVNNTLIPHGEDLTDEEYNFLSQYTDMFWIDIRRIDSEDIEEVLQQYLGIGLEDLENPDHPQLPYWEETGCYYLIANDADYTEGFHAEAVEVSEDGTICLTYTCNSSDSSRMVRLMPYGDGYRILSNLQITE